MGITPNAVVVGPVRKPIPFGLFSVVANRENGTGERWEGGGVTFEGLGCDSISGISEADCESAVSYDFTSGVDSATANTFTVYGTYDCSPVGRSPEDAQAMANSRLLTREEARVEQAFWTGDLDNTPSLKGADKLTTTATTAKQALGLLEDWLGTGYGSAGVIHMSREAATILLAGNLLSVSGQRLHTRLGTPVVAGAGYDNSGPTGTASGAGYFWIYATPAILMYRSDVFTAVNSAESMLTRNSNDLSATAERTYLLGFENCGPEAVQFSV